MRDLSIIEIQNIHGGVDLFTGSLFLAQNAVWALTAYVGIREMKGIFLSYSVGNALAHTLGTPLLGVPIGAMIGVTIGAVCGYMGYTLIATI